MPCSLPQTLRGRGLPPTDAVAHVHSGNTAPSLIRSVCNDLCAWVQNLSGPGLTTTLELPPVHTMQSHDTLELDFQLGCPGTVDADW